MPSLLSKIVRKVARQLYRSARDYVRIIDLKLWTMPELNLASDIRIVPYAPRLDVLLYQHFPRRIIDDFAQRSRLSQGFVALRGEEALGYIWATTEPRGAEGEPPFLYEIHPAPDQSYLYDLKVSPTARGSGIGLALMAHGMQWAKDLGRRSMLFTTALDNQPIHRLTQKLGFRDVGIISMKQFCRLPFVDLSALQQATRPGGMTHELS